MEYLLPVISVILPVFNEDKYLKESVNSLLNQSFKNFELIIIDDASTNPETHKIIDNIKTKDNRIKAIKNETNLGLTKSLNIAIKKAQGKYIARMDADDISHKERLRIQYNFLEKNKEIGICGTWIKMFNKIHKKYISPFDHEHILVKSFIQCPFFHPTVMFRKDLFFHHNLFYNENIRYSQDYELWTRALRVTKGANIPKYLLYYRVHNNQISILKAQEQNKTISYIYNNILQDLLKNNYSIQFSQTHFNYVTGNFSVETFNKSKVGAWKNFLLDANKKTRIYNTVLFKNKIDILEHMIYKKYYYHLYIKNPKIINILPFFNLNNKPFKYFKLTTSINFILKSLKNINVK
jgi:glycosyltransferase involved in cell wall biosynthesis